MWSLSRRRSEGSGLMGQSSEGCSDGGRWHYMWCKLTMHCDVQATSVCGSYLALLSGSENVV